MVPRRSPARSSLPDRSRTRMRYRAGLLVALSATVGGVTACMGADAHRPGPQVRLAARIRAPASAAFVLNGTAADVVTARVAHELFASAPVVVVASGEGSGLAVACRRARQVHAPLLLTATQRAATPPPPSPPAPDAPLIAEIHALGARAVLAVGPAPRLPGIHVVASPAELPATSAPTALQHVGVLIHADDVSAGTTAAVTTAQVAGATVIPVHGDDPRADPAAITALAAARPQQVLAIGAGFGSDTLLGSRIAVAETGVQLPGGGQVIFPGRRLVALYGHPGAPALGALGQQDLPGSIARIRRVAAWYRRLSSVPVIPTFEIIATVALGSPGRDGTYSAESSVADLLPWVRRATSAGMYVVLDLQPGRASLLAQAKMYAPLLMLPNVGLALDPEWKLQPGQMPLRQIGGTDISEINGVVGWLADLTARHHLPQKLLVLHQFKLSMIRRENDLDTGHDDLAIVIHMDGQGTPGTKQTTWNAVTAAAPRRVFFGWKNFFQEDHPMISPHETMARTPAPVVISYQ